MFNQQRYNIVLESIESFKKSDLEEFEMVFTEEEAHQLTQEPNLLDGLVVGFDKLRTPKSSILKVYSISKN